MYFAIMRRKSRNVPEDRQVLTMDLCRLPRSSHLDNSVLFWLLTEPPPQVATHGGGFWLFQGWNHPCEVADSGRAGSFRAVFQDQP